MHVSIRFRRWSGLIFTSMMLVSGVARAETLLTLEQAEAMALQHNPGLSAVGKQAEAMAEIPPQVGALPDPVISMNAMNLPTDSFSLTQENMTQMQLGVSQAFPFPGKLGLKEEAARHLADAARQNEAEFRLLLLRNVRIHWWNLAYLDKALTIIRRNQDLLRNLVRVAETKYKTGKGLQQDVLLAQLELSKLLEQEIRLSAEREREEASLNALMGQPAKTQLHLPEQQQHGLAAIHIDVAALKAEAKHTRPMLLAMDERVQAADAMVSLAEKDYYPDFKVGGAYGFRQGVNPANGRSRPDFASLMLSMTIPLYSGSKQDRALDQRHAEKAEAEFSWQDAVNQVDAEIDVAASDFVRARDQVVLFEKGIIPQARQTTSSMLAGYQVNKVDFLNLVRAQLSEFNTDIRYWRQIARAHQAHARLAAAAGRQVLE